MTTNMTTTMTNMATTNLAGHPTHLEIPTTKLVDVDIDHSQCCEILVGGKPV